MEKEYMKKRISDMLEDATVEEVSIIFHYVRALLFG